MALGKIGEWYWGAKCPKCGQMAAHTHDALRGKGNIKIQSENPGKTRTQMTCPDGHRFDVAAENMIRFEWGAQ
jgi:hypothetical protein